MFESSQFNSLAEFMAMDGHGVFVWSVYAVTLVVFIVLVSTPLRKSRRFFTEQAMLIRREQAQAKKT